MWIKKGQKFINFDHVKKITEGPTGNAIFHFIDGEEMDLGVKFSDAQKLTDLHEDKKYGGQ